MAKQDRDEGLGGPYDTVAFEPTWSGLSFCLFLLTLPTPYLVRLQPWRPKEIWMWPLITPMVIGILSLLGVVAGLLGLRFSENKSLARWSLLLNGIVVGFIFLIWVVMRLIVGNR